MFITQIHNIRHTSPNSNIGCTKIESSNEEGFGGIRNHVSMWGGESG